MASRFSQRQSIIDNSSAKKAEQVELLVNAFYTELNQKLDSHAHKRVLYPSDVVVDVIPTSVDGLEASMINLDTLTEARDMIINGFIEYQIQNGYPKERYAERENINETIKLRASSLEHNYLSFTINI